VVKPGLALQCRAVLLFPPTCACSLTCLLCLQSRVLCPLSLLLLQLGDLEVGLGDGVLLAAKDGDDVAPLGLVQAMWQTSDGAQLPANARLLLMLLLLLLICVCANPAIPRLMATLAFVISSPKLLLP
jgi:hypothetical protein